MRRMVRKLRPTCKNTSDHEKKKSALKKIGGDSADSFFFPKFFANVFLKLQTIPCASPLIRQKKNQQTPHSE